MKIIIVLAIFLAAPAGNAAFVLNCGNYLAGYPISKGMSGVSRFDFHGV